MPIKILRPDHTELVGTGHVLLTAPHAADSQTSLYTGKIVEDAALASRAYAAIGKVSNAYSDSERLHTARTELRKSIDNTVDENAIKCILDIHGKQEPGVEIGPGLGATCADETVSLVTSFLSTDFKVTIDNEHHEAKPGDAQISYERRDGKGAFTVQSVQLILGGEEREMQRDKLVDKLAELVGLLNARLGLDASANATHAED